jgi:hypothetical protein
MSLRQTPTLTPALLAANRRNAQKSTGPRSEAGKRRVRLNGLKHGLRCNSFRESLIRSGEPTTLVDRNFLFLTLYLLPQKRYEVHRVANLVRLLWSVEHWGRRHQVRAAAPDRLVKNLVTDFELQALLHAREQAIADLARRRRNRAPELSLQQAHVSGPDQSSKEPELLRRTGPILLPGFVPPQRPAKPRLVRSRWEKIVRPKPESQLESAISIFARTVPEKPVDDRSYKAERDSEVADKTERPKPESRAESAISIFSSYHPRETCTR